MPIPHIEIVCPETKFLAVPGGSSLGQRPSTDGGETLVPPRSADSKLGEKWYEEEEDPLRPDPGTEHDFKVENNPFAFSPNPFAFSPGQLAKFFNPKSSMHAFRALGGIQGLERGLRTDLKAGLGLDENTLDGQVSFQDAIGTVDRNAHADRERKKVGRKEKANRRVQSRRSRGDSKVVPGTFFHRNGPLERWNGGTPKKVGLRFSNRVPGTPLELLPELPSGMPTLNPPNDPKKSFGSPLSQAGRKRSGTRGRLNDHPVLAFADNGSEFNIMTEKYAFEHEFSIDRSPEHIRVVPMATGKPLHFIGRVTVDFAFEGEPDVTRSVDFYVVTNCVHDVTLGDHFLRETKTLDVYAHRLVEMPPLIGRKILRIYNIGSPHRKLPLLVRSSRGGQKFPMNALPDMGAEGEVISEDYARKKRLKFEPSDTIFMLPDETMIESRGRVQLDLSFVDEPTRRIRTYFEVMPGCRHEAILSHSFVFAHRLFSENIHRLVDTIAQLGLNAIAFITGWRRTDPVHLKQQELRNSQDQAFAEASRQRRRVGQSNGTANILSNPAPVPMAQNPAQPSIPGQVASINTAIPLPATVTNSRPRPPWWKRLFT